MKKRKKILILIGILVFAIIILLISIEMLSNPSSKKKEYKSINDFSSIQEMVEYMKCKYIKEKKSKEKDYDLDVYLELYKDLYTDGNSNEDYYTKLINNMAGVSGYKNIRMIDEKKDITIAIKCDKENKIIDEIKINGIENYFKYEDSKETIENYKDANIINVNVQSNILNNAINANWERNQIKFGSKDSDFENYEIFFDEGIEVRTVDSKIYNIIFNNRYQQEIVEGIKVGENFQEIINKLGTPEFGEEDSSYIGYITESFYIFFSNDEISIYPKEDTDKEKFANLMNIFSKDNDEKKLMKNLTDIWQDYDSYEYNEKAFEITYALKGIKISYSGSEKDGVYVYKNYTGTLCNGIEVKDIISNKSKAPQNIILKLDTDLVDEKEAFRILKKQDGIVHDEAGENERFSKNKKFAIILDQDNKNLKVVSLDSKFPNREWNKNIQINSYKWYDEKNLIYSIKNKGIYVYNAENAEISVVVEGNEEFTFNKLENNTLTYDTNKEIKFN